MTTTRIDKSDEKSTSSDNHPKQVADVLPEDVDVDDGEWDMVSEFKLSSNIEKRIFASFIQCRNDFSAIKQFILELPPDYMFTLPVLTFDCFEQKNNTMAQLSLSHVFFNRRQQQDNIIHSICRSRDGELLDLISERTPPAVFSESLCRTTYHRYNVLHILLDPDDQKLPQENLSILMKMLRKIDPETLDKLVTMPSIRGETPLALAFKMTDHSCARELLSKISKVTAQKVASLTLPLSKQNSLHLAIQHKVDDETITVFLDLMDKDTLSSIFFMEDNAGFTPLEYAFLPSTLLTFILEQREPRILEFLRFIYDALATLNINQSCNKTGILLATYIPSDFLYRLYDQINHTEIVNRKRAKEILPLANPALHNAILQRLSDPYYGLFRAETRHTMNRLNYQTVRTMLDEDPDFEWHPLINMHPLILKWLYTDTYGALQDHITFQKAIILGYAALTPKMPYALINLILSYVECSDAILHLTPQKIDATEAKLNGKLQQALISNNGHVIQGMLYNAERGIGRTFGTLYSPKNKAPKDSSENETESFSDEEREHYKPS